jgi:hypothetical protein
MQEGGAAWTDTIAVNLLFLPDKLAGDKMTMLMQKYAYSGQVYKRLAIS